MVEDRDIQLLIVPGIGEDERMSYPQTALPYRLIRPRYIQPRKGESMATYCARFAEELLPQIDPSKPLFLMGVSLGSAMVQELSRHLPAQGLILISGYRTSAELLPFFRILGRHLAPRLPLWFYKAGEMIARPLVTWLMQASSKDNKLCAQMYKDFPKSWFKEQARMGAWWKGCRVTVPKLRVHGVGDPIFPYFGQRDIEIAVEDDRHMVNLGHKDLTNNMIQEWIRKRLDQVNVISPINEQAPRIA